MAVLTIISNFFAHTLEVERKNQKSWVNWYYSDQVQSEFQKRKIEPKEHEIYRGRRYIDHETNTEKISVDRSSKGRILRTKLEEIKNSNEDSEHYSDYVVYVDGDGDIDFNDTFKVMDVLMNKSGVCFTCRRGKYMMGQVRDSIERFENYLLENKYGVSLPDGQCGCWGFRKEILKKNYNLSAEGFEIELDILCMCLDTGILPYFVPIKLNLNEPNSVSSFSIPEHKIKLSFLIEKLGLPTSFLHALYKNFCIEYPTYQLDPKYMRLLQEITGFPIERKLPKCDEKGPCTRCDLTA